MIKLTVCSGSSCHHKSSNKIIKLLQTKIVEMKMEDLVELTACFCLGRCADGFNVKIEEEIVSFQTLEECELHFVKLFESLKIEFDKTEKILKVV